MENSDFSRNVGFFVYLNGCMKWRHLRVFVIYWFHVNMLAGINFLLTNSYRIRDPTLYSDCEFSFSFKNLPFCENIIIRKTIHSFLIVLSVQLIRRYHHYHHREHQGLDPFIRSVSRVTAARANASSVFQLFSFRLVCSGMISEGFGLWHIRKCMKRKWTYIDMCICLTSTALASYRLGR